MEKKIRLQLSSMMFLQYFIWGSWYVTLGTFLGMSLEFDGPQIGLIYGTVAIGAMVSPFFVGMIADRFFPSERVLGVLHLLGGVLLLIVAQISTFGLFYTVILLYTISYMPTIALTNALSFHQMEDPGKQFPGVRVLGTLGWIVAGVLVGLLKVEDQAVPLQIAAAGSLVLGIYSFTLPHTPPKHKGEKPSAKDILGLDALKLMKNFSFAVLVICSLLVCIPLSFYYNFTNLYFNSIGMENAAAKMTMGQASEVIFMLVMPFFFKRLGVKNLILIAITAWVARYFLFAFGGSESLVWMLYLGIILHGICYDFFFVTGQIYVDKKADKSIRSAAQGLLTLATYGIGMFIGAWFSGYIVGLFTTVTDGDAIYNWKQIWIVPMITSVIIFFIFGFLFRDRVRESKKKQQLATTS